MAGRGRSRRRLAKRPAETSKSQPEVVAETPSAVASTSKVDVKNVQVEVHEEPKGQDVPKKSGKVITEKTAKVVNLESSTEDDVHDVTEFMDSTDDMVSLSDETELQTHPFPDIEGNISDDIEKQSKGKRKKNIVSYNFTEEEEAEISEWFQSNPCLYNKRNRDFRKTSMKVRLIQEKAETFSPPCTCKYKLNYEMLYHFE